MEPVFALFTRMLPPRPAPGSPAAYPARIGDHFRSTQKTSIRNMGLADQVRIGKRVTLWDAQLTCCATGEIRIGDDLRMGPAGQMIACRSISVGNFCVFGRDVYLSDTDAPERNHQAIRFQEPGSLPGGSAAGPAPIRLGNDIWVGEGPSF
jgi:hypothetical protein